MRNAVWVSEKRDAGYAHPIIGADRCCAALQNLIVRQARHRPLQNFTRLRLELLRLAGGEIGSEACFG